MHRDVVNEELGAVEVVAAAVQSQGQSRVGRGRVQDYVLLLILVSGCSPDSGRIKRLAVHYDIYVAASIIDLLKRGQGPVVRQHVLSSAVQAGKWL